MVTASALLDLVGADWLTRVVDHCRAAEVAVLFALNYDGRIEFAPADPLDATVRTLVNRHQIRDKGFGPALGPGAIAAVSAALTAADFDVAQAPSDWVVAPDARELQRMLFDGWAAAASEVDPAGRATFRAWQARRERWLEAGVSRLVVGHVDIAARAGRGR